ncbi:MAG: hypothetical protein ACK4V6_17875 [Microthrixaceae bacterium]
MAEVSFSCVRHPMTMGEHICGECGHQFCPECVVFPFGTSKPAMCIACALERGGVRRQSTGRPKLARKSIRERLALHRQLTAPPAANTTDPTPAAPPVAEQDPWLEGHVEPEDVPGAWRQEY